MRMRVRMMELGEGRVTRKGKRLSEGFAITPRLLVSGVCSGVLIHYVWF